MDFCIIDKRIDIEIDGNQHYDDIKIVESDKRRNIYLEELGWDIIRIRWSEYQLLDKISKVEYIDNITYYINGLIEEKPIFKIIDKNNYCICGSIIHRKSKSCIDCCKISQRKVERPSQEELLKSIEETNYVITGKKYGVSDNCIRKWVKHYKNKLKTNNNKLIYSIMKTIINTSSSSSSSRSIKSEVRSCS